ncbi:translationally-controlled tumor protein-like protein [Corchorus olitorius]|uniref:Translationally-controlled tumor protein-like protein n=1 Tax=Corchorus olitorius TaxID=93759 RepID=A0A1R3GVT8_9ROSI|nr:translationally-controlled tumor protein-like protein [Corchorus olitorius]
MVNGWCDQRLQLDSDLHMVNTDAVHNQLGEVLLCGVSRVDNVSSSVMYTEALAIILGLELAWERGFTNLQVESDAAVLISEIQLEEKSIWQDRCAIS